MLSPSEMHSLFHGLDLTGTVPNIAGNAGTSLPPNSPTAQFVLPLEVGSAERTVLIACQAEFRERWPQTWPGILRERFSLTDSQVGSMRLQQFLAAVGDDGCFQAQAADQTTLWLMIDETFVRAYSDLLLGASNAADVPGKRYATGPLERQLASRLVQTACELLFSSSLPASARNWQIEPIASSVGGIASAPVFLACEMVHMDFDISCAVSTGRISLAIPRGQLANWSAGRLNQKSAAHDGTCHETAETVNLRVVLNPLELSHAEFAQLQIGDVLLTGQPGQSPCSVELNGETKFQATVGSHQGHKAIRLIDT